MNFLISFPRSGHHIMVDVIEDITKLNNLPFSYCEFYTCCNQIPCTKNSFLAKNHDFDLDIPITPENKYIVLYRDDPFEQLEAWYRYQLLYPNSVDDLNVFIERNIQYYNNFRNKWVDNNYQNIIKITYDEFLKDPDQIFKNILNVLFPSNTCSIQNTKQIYSIYKKYNYRNGCT